MRRRVWEWEVYYQSYHSALRSGLATLCMGETNVKEANPVLSLVLMACCGAEGNQLVNRLI